MSMRNRNWHRWWAWRPVTDGLGWHWLRPVWRRREWRPERGGVGWRYLRFGPHRSMEIDVKTGEVIYQ